MAEFYSDSPYTLNPREAGRSDTRARGETDRNYSRLPLFNHTP
jgi:hypothetical protein